MSNLETIFAGFFYAKPIFQLGPWFVAASYVASIPFMESRFRWLRVASLVLYHLARAGLGLMVVLAALLLLIATFILVVAEVGTHTGDTAVRHSSKAEKC